MGRARVVAWAALAAAIAGLTGCYASTEPATEVTQDGARLNAHGTADAGPAETFFEYWPTAGGAPVLRTLTRTWPTGASGPLSEAIGGMTFPGPLSASTQYSFRVCGNDVGAQPVCAQTRTFTTPAPIRDAARGFWADFMSPHAPSGRVDASAGPSGKRPTGTVSHFLYEFAIAFAGRVTCLRVRGDRAVVGAIGSVTRDGSAPDPDADPPTASTLLTILDGGPSGVDRTNVAFDPGSGAPPRCSAGATDGTPSASGSVNVYDARRKR